jgi:hypothetical protein
MIEEPSKASIGNINNHIMLASLSSRRGVRGEVTK